jgi:hypothetical protein
MNVWIIRAAAAALLGLGLPALAQPAGQQRRQDRREDRRNGRAAPPLGYTAVSAANLTDSTGTPIGNATIAFAPVDNSGKPISYQVNGVGQAHSQPVTTLVVSGAMNIQLADTALTRPQNVCFSVTITDNISGKNLLGHGYECFQPAGSGPMVTTGVCTAATSSAGGSCNFDLFVPNLPGQALIQTGPTGPQGPPNNLAIGTTSTLPPGSQATSQITGASPNQTLNLGIPAGIQGASGPPYTGCASDGANGMNCSGGLAAAKTVVPQQTYIGSGAPTVQTWQPTNTANTFWNSCWINGFNIQPVCGVPGIGYMGPFVRVVWNNPVQPVNQDSYQVMQIHGDAITGGVNQSSPSTQKSNFNSLTGSQLSYTPGQHAAITARMFNGSYGDTAGLVVLNYEGGNTNAAGDEGIEGAVIRTGQMSTEFTGIVSSVSGNVLNYTSPVAEYDRGEGRLVINQTTGMYTTGTIASISGTPPTVTGTGTAWTTLGAVGAVSNLCFSLTNANTQNPANTHPYVNRVRSIGSDTSIVLDYSFSGSDVAWAGDATTGAYTMYKCSKVTKVAETGSMTVADGTQFTTGDHLMIPLGDNVLINGIALSVQPFVPSSAGGGYAIAIGAYSNTRWYRNAITFAGNYTNSLFLHTSGGVTPIANSTYYTDQTGMATIHNLSGYGASATTSLLLLTRGNFGGTYIEQYAHSTDNRTFNGAASYVFTMRDTTAGRFWINSSSGIPVLYCDAFTTFGCNVNNSAMLYGNSGNQSTRTWSLNAGNGVFQQYPQGTPATVATLPTCNAAARGSYSFVTDGNAPTYLSTITGGGAVVTPVFCSGTAWVAH